MPTWVPIAGIVVWLMVVSTVGYVALHFILKFW